MIVRRPHLKVEAAAHAMRLHVAQGELYLHDRPVSPPRLPVRSGAELEQAERRGVKDAPATPPLPQQALLDEEHPLPRGGHALLAVGSADERREAPQVVGGDARRPVLGRLLHLVEGGAQRAERGALPPVLAHALAEWRHRRLGVRLQPARHLLGALEQRRLLVRVRVGRVEVVAQLLAELQPRAAARLEQAALERVAGLEHRLLLFDGGGLQVGRGGASRLLPVDALFRRVLDSAAVLRRWRRHGGGGRGGG
mmetsp:Transcript_28616/g.71220  ORF Transcript_28616/g.71220 Transcript_28616/m.71220 type:complete len:253 (+) Transcript_28616:671-1429(+)